MDYACEPGNIRAQYDDPNNPLNRPISIMPRRYSFARWKDAMKYNEGKEIVDPTYTITSSVFLGRYDKIDEKIQLKQTVNIINCVFNDTVNFININSNYRVTFSNCQFKSNIELINLSFLQLSFTYCDFNQNFLIRDCKINKIDIEHSKINQFTIKETTILSEKSTENKLINFDVIFQYVHLSISNFYSLKASILKSECFFIEPHEGKTNINNDFNKHNGNKKFIILEHPLINKFEINYYEKSDRSRVIIRDLILKELTLSGTLTKELLLLKDITLTHLKLVDFTNEGKSILQNINISESGGVMFYNSKLGKIEFNNVNCSESNYLNFIGSNLLDVVLINTSLPSKVIGETDKDYKNIREAWKQLKQVYSKQGNKLEEIKMGQEELDAYYQSLNCKNNFADKSNLWLNKFSSSYGPNIGRSFLVLLCFSVISYIVYCFTLGYRFGSSLDTFIRLGSYIIEYINPLRKADYIADDLGIKVMAGSRVWEGFSKILIAYFIYQFIQASRKFGK